MTESEQRRIEEEGWEFMGHTPNNPWDAVAEHMAALRGGDTGFHFMMHSPLPNEPRYNVYSVWRKKRTETEATHVHG
jgi:hypothetical protein